MFRTLATLAAATLATAAHADILLNETFTYPDGNLVGNGGWTAHSGSGSVPVQVAGGAAHLAQGSLTREDVNTPFTAAAAGTTIYAGFDLVNNGGSTAVYVAHLLESGTTSFASRVFIVPAPDASDYGIGFNSSSTVPTVGAGNVWSTGFAFGSANRVIVSYDFDTGEQRMWINPVDMNSTSIAVTGFMEDAISAFALRQAGGDSTQIVDNVLVATTFGEVIPAPGSAAVLLAGLGLVARRRR